MDISAAIINGLLTTVGYLVIFLGVYKVFQIATDIREIKDLVASGRRASAGAVPPAPLSVPRVPPAVTKDLIAEDSADAYAEQLLRSVGGDSQRS